MKTEYNETAPNGKETGVKVIVKVPITERELSDIIFKARMQREHSISGISLGLDVHIARALLERLHITEK